MISELPISDVLKKSVAPSEPVDVRLAFARGEVPLSNLEMVSVYSLLIKDPEEKVRSSATKSLLAIPQASIIKVLGINSFPEGLLDVIAEYFSDNNAIIQQLLTHQNLSADSALALIPQLTALQVKILAGNVRLLKRSEEVVKALLASGLLSKEDLSALTDEASNGEPSSLGSDGLDEEAAETPSLQEIAREEAAKTMEVIDDSPLNDGKNIYQLIQGLSVAEKIKLATLGSAGARKLLAKDTNRSVVSAVIHSPKIREDEVLLIAQDRMMADEIISYILTRKEWLKNYPIRLALAQNPKTPMPRAIRLLETLQERDLRTLSKSRNVASVIATSALRILHRRGKN
ncbi:MAG: hypothetical protein C0609_09145 [Deltaproteobacteria bacterium]|nr:MAG: hypothetical protein C0609_09145 [Deltaproteobacteria bacterium]